MNRLNENARYFYQKFGYLILTGKDLVEYYSIRKDDSVTVFDDYLKELDGSEFILLEKLLVNN